MKDDAQGDVEIAENTHDAALDKNSITIGSEQWDLARITAAAQEVTASDHKIPFRAAVRLYPKAILFSLGISLCLVMEGYDTGLGTSFWALPQFREKYGTRLADGTYQVPVAWQSATGAMSSVGSIIGLLISGVMVDRIGYRYTVLTGLTILTGFIFITFFAQNIVMLFLGNMLCGFPWGMFQSVASAYATDVAPLAVRPLLTSYINLCWVMGQFLSTGVLRSLLNRQDQWAYRIPFGVQWLWPIPIALVTIFAPESPWWLTKKDRLEDARKTLRRIAASQVSDEEIDKTVAMMYLTNLHEQEIEKGTSYMELFKGTNLRRTEVAVGAWVCQVTCGNWFGGTITYFMQQAGADANASFGFGLGMNGVSFVATILWWFLAPRVGRRQAYLVGMTAELVTLMIIGFMGIPTHKTAGIQWATGAVLIVNVMFYMVTLGPVCYTIVPEVPTVRLRNKTVVAARATYNIFAVMAGFLNPALVNPTGWNLIQKGAFVWAAFCLPSLIWVYFRLPETKDRTPIELDELFERKVPTRQFAKTTIVAFEEEEQLVAATEKVAHL